MGEGDTALVQREQSQGITIHQLTKDQKELIKRTVAKGATDDELTLFIHYCQKAGVDPLRKQAHFIKRKDGSTTMMIGIDGFQAKATSDPKYEGIVSQAVHENDEFSLNPVSGEVKHLIKPKNRGEIVGAYAVLKRKGLDPAVVWVDLKEFKQDSWIWREKPETMITKTARATLLRREYPDVFSGVYEPSEFGMDQNEEGDIIEPKKTEAKTVDAQFTPAPGDYDRESEADPEPTPETPEANGQVSHVEKVPEKSKETTQPKVVKTGSEVKVHIPKGIIKEDMKPRVAFSKVQNQALMRNQMAELRDMILEEMPSYDPATMHPYHIPESTIILIVKNLTGIELNGSEKDQSCKKCQKVITQAEGEEQEGLCLNCWTQKH